VDSYRGIQSTLLRNGCLIVGRNDHGVAQARNGSRCLNESDECKSLTHATMVEKSNWTSHSFFF